MIQVLFNFFIRQEAESYRDATFTLWSKVYKEYLIVQGWKRVPNGPRLVDATVTPGGDP